MKHALVMKRRRTLFTGASAVRCFAPVPPPAEQAFHVAFGTPRGNLVRIASDSPRCYTLTSSWYLPPSDACGGILLDTALEEVAAEGDP